MENRQKITFFANTISADLCRYGAPTTGVGCLDDLAEALRALGLEVEVERRPQGRAKVTIGYPTPLDAGQARTRRAGRRSYFDGSKSTVFNSSTPAADALAWLDAHSVDEGAEALGCSRSSYFRWRDRLRQNVTERAALDAQRQRAGQEPLGPLTLSDAIQRKPQN